MSPALFDKIESKVKKVLPHSDSPSPKPVDQQPATVTREASTSSSLFKCRNSTSKSSTPASSVTNVPSTLGGKGTPASSVSNIPSTNTPSQPGTPLPRAGPPDPRPVNVPAPTLTQDFDAPEQAHHESTLDTLRGKAKECKEKLTPNFMTHECSSGSSSGGVPCSQLFSMFKALASEDSRDGDTSDSDADEPPRRRMPEKRRSLMSQVSTVSSGQTTDVTDGDESPPGYNYDGFGNLHRSESEPQFLPTEEEHEHDPHAAMRRHASISTTEPALHIARFDESDPEVQRWLRETLGPVQLSQLNLHDGPRKAPQTSRAPQPRRPKALRRPTDVPEGNEEEDDSEDAMVVALNDANPAEGARIPPEQYADLTLAQMAEKNAEEGEQEREDREKFRADHGHANTVPPAGEASPEEKARFNRSEVPEKEKLRVMREEFGDIASVMVDAQGRTEPERILAESQGSLFRGVMMVGNLHLTTHRLMFHALLPPDNMITQGPDFESVDDNEAAALKARPDIIQAGSVTLHQSGMFTSKKRVWMELTPEMLTCCPSADDAGKTRPLFSILSE